MCYIMAERIASEKTLIEIAGIWEDDELERKIGETRENGERTG